MAKFKKYKNEGYVYPHKHCPRCQAMIPETEEYCSEECRVVYEKKEHKGKKSLFIFIGVYVLVMILMFVFILAPK